MSAVTPELLEFGPTSPFDFPNGWNILVSQKKFKFPQWAIQQVADLLRQWVTVFPRENSWIWNTHGVPSPVVRVEGVMVGNRFWVYEIEDRPCGLGIVSHINLEFAATLLSLREGWFNGTPVRWVKDPERITDDLLWLGEGITLEEARANPDQILLVRSRPEDSRFHCLIPQAVGPVATEGDKKYGVHLGLWTELGWVHDGDGWYIPNLPGGPLVCKPPRGTRTNGIRFYSDSNDPIRKGSGVNWIGITALERARARNQIRFAQKLIPPHPTNVDDHFAIYRFYCGWNPDIQAYVPMGGVVNAARGFLVHGTSGCIMAPLVF